MAKINVNQLDKVTSQQQSGNFTNKQKIKRGNKQFI